MNVEKIRIAELRSDPKNARKHSARNLEAIQGSLRSFGQQKPIIVDCNMMIVAGHGTVAAAKALGWSEVFALKTGLSERDATAFALADNRTAELAEWDEDILKELIGSLDSLDFDVSQIGFEFSDFFSNAPDYGLIEGEGQTLDDLKGGVRKAIQIEFELAHYQEAFDLVKYFRDKGINVGMLMLDHLRQEKARREA